MVQYELHPLLSSDRLPLTRLVGQEVIKSNDAGPNFGCILIECYGLQAPLKFMSGPFILAGHLMVCVVLQPLMPQGVH